MEMSMSASCLIVLLKNRGTDDLKFQTETPRFAVAGESERRCKIDSASLSVLFNPIRSTQVYGETCPWR